MRRLDSDRSLGEAAQSDIESEKTVVVPLFEGQQYPTEDGSELQVELFVDAPESARRQR